MSRPSWAAALTLVVVIYTAIPASAQQSQPAQAEPAPSSSIVSTAPNPVPSQEAWLQGDLDDAAERVRRTRIALISTSATLGVGIILAGIGASQCTRTQVYTPNYYDDYVCNTAGNVLLPLGGTLSFMGFVGVLTSGIMFGKARGKKREIERDLRRIQYGGRLHWDAASGGFVF